MKLTKALPILLFAGIGACYVIWSWSSVLGGFGGDNAYYLFMARHFSPYSEESMVTAHFTANSIYPPLFPILLSLTGGGESLLAAHLTTTGFLLGAFAFFYSWLRQEGIGPITTCMTLLAFVLMPGLYFQTLSVHSENLYLMCSLAAMAFTLNSLRNNKTSIWMFYAVIAITAAYLTRSAGLSLIGAWVAFIWLNRMPQRILFSFLIILPVLLWSHFGSSHSIDYWSQLTNGYHDPQRYLNQVWLQSQYLLNGWLANFGSSHTANTAGVLLLILGLVAALIRGWKRQLDGLYVWFYLGMIVLWPFPAEAQRMILVLIPIMLLQAVWLLSLWRSNATVQPLNMALIATLLLASLPELALTIERFNSPLPSEISQNYRHTEGWYSPDPADAIADVRLNATLEAEIRNIKELIAENECIYAIKPSVIAYLSDRISKAPPSVKSDQETFDKELQGAGCRYLFMLAYASPSYPVSLYPYHRVEPRLGTIKPIFARTADGRIGVAALFAELK